MRFWVLVALLFACTNQTSSGSYEIQSSTGQSLARITLSNEIEVDVKGRALRSVTKREDKRKYYDPSNTMVFALKMDDDGFKLRDQNESLLWKVKLYPDKIKISKNEEMNNAYEIKLKEEGRLKLEKNDAEVMQIRLMENAESYPVGDFTVKGFGASIACGILLIPEIPEQQKWIIIGELLYRKR